MIPPRGNQAAVQSMTGKKTLNVGQTDAEAPNTAGIILNKTIEAAIDVAEDQAIDPVTTPTGISFGNKCFAEEILNFTYYS